MEPETTRACHDVQTASRRRGFAAPGLRGRKRAPAGVGHGLEIDNPDLDTDLLHPALRQATAARVIAEAETNARSKVNKFDQERAMLENSINELRTFEREYRAKLRGYIESQLKDLDGMTAEAASTR